MRPPASNKTPRSFLRLPSYPLGKPTERLFAELSGAAAGWRVPQRSPSARYPRPTSTKPPLTPCICLTTMSRSQGARPGRETHENSQGASVICNKQTVVRARKALTGEICPHPWMSANDSTTEPTGTSRRRTMGALRLGQKQRPAVPNHTQQRTKHDTPRLDLAPRTHTARPASTAQTLAPALHCSRTASVLASRPALPNNTGRYCTYTLTHPHTQGSLAARPQPRIASGVATPAHPPASKPSIRLRR